MPEKLTPEIMEEMLREDVEPTLPSSPPKAVKDFENFVEHDFINFLQANRLEKGSISNGCGESATVRTDKHGFYKVKYSKVKDNL
jgi:hypothetical protein